MSRIATAFFGCAVVYALGGMVLGIVMAASNDHTFMPVHAHINLLGWASLAVMGAFYGIAGEAAPRKLAWTNFAISNLGNLTTLPALALLLRGNTKVIPVVSVGELLIVLGMVVFGVAVLTVARRPTLAA